LSQVAIGSAIAVHRLKGPGLIESIYERCLMRELELRHVAAVNQRVVKIKYKGLLFDEQLRLLDVPLGLLINFHELKLVDGLVRMILPGANR
jgi:hypothetical protein